MQPTRRRIEAKNQASKKTLGSAHGGQTGRKSTYGAGTIYGRGLASRPEYEAAPTRCPYPFRKTVIIRRRRKGVRLG